jgi:hypothetical protein
MDADDVGIGLFIGFIVGVALMTLFANFIIEPYAKWDGACEYRGGVVDGNNCVDGDFIIDRRD